MLYTEAAPGQTEGMGLAHNPGAENGGILAFFGNSMEM
jgi:hypothetical protein